MSNNREKDIIILLQGLQLSTSHMSDILERQDAIFRDLETTLPDSVHDSWNVQLTLSEVLFLIGAVESVLKKDVKQLVSDGERAEDVLLGELVLIDALYRKLADTVLAFTNSMHEQYFGSEEKNGL